MDQHYHLVIDVTMRDTHAVATVATRLREAGYDVEGRVMAVNALISTQHYTNGTNCKCKRKGSAVSRGKSSMRVHLPHYLPAWSSSSATWRLAS
jgi:hypothetical protein